MSANVELKERSSTLKSNFTDYDTPPETPEFRIDRLVGWLGNILRLHVLSGSSSLNSTLSRSNKDEATNGATGATFPSPSSPNTEDIVSFFRIIDWWWRKIFNNLLQSQSVLNEEWSPNESGEGSPPIPPPRPKRKNKIKIKNLSLDSNETLREESHQNDILFRTDSATRLNKDISCLKGSLKMLNFDNF